MNPGFHDEVLKGGSLNRTVLRTLEDGRRFVRKSVARADNREYGFVRWYSQYKRLQRYEALFPGLFPEILSVGEEDGAAYFDLRYVEGSVNLKDYLVGERSDEELVGAVQALFAAADLLHDGAEFKSHDGSLRLYFAEEVEQRLSDAAEHAAFRTFCEQPEIVLNGRSCVSLVRNLDWLRDAFAALPPSAECHTHGNMTLENVLFTPDAGRIHFIDPYEENVVDCREAEYSQVFQCSRQHYGFINDRCVTIDGPRADFHEPLPPALLRFNDLFEAELDRRLNAAQHTLVRFLEASQFTRMLPFKLAVGDLDKACYFYAVASQLVHRLRGASGVEGDAVS